jgi:uncharacterized protein
MRFFVDRSLGSLAKWLRFLGFDVVQTKITSQELRTLPQPKRDTFIITRQSSIPKKFSRPDLVILASDRPQEQLTEICRRLDLPPETWEPLNRCSDCNKILQPITPDQVEGRVPDFISQKHQLFFECPQCLRVFWEGSQQRRIRRRLQELQDHILTP